MNATPIPGGLRIGGEATDIIQALRDFGRNAPVPLGLVARAVGREPDHILDSLRVLQEKAVIRFDEGKGLVTLIR